jgi:hypothetical protein
MFPLEIAVPRAVSRAGFLNKKEGPAGLWFVFVNEEVFRVRMSLGLPDYSLP